MKYIIRNTNNPLLSNTASSIIIRGTTTLTRIVVLFIIAKHTNPQFFGIITFAVTIAEIAKVITDFGVDTYAIREYARTSKNSFNQQLGSTVLRTKIFNSFVTYIILVLFICLIHTIDYVILTTIIGLIVFTGTWINFSLDYFQAQLRTSSVVIPILVVNILVIIIEIILFSIQAHVFIAIAVLPIAEALNGWIIYRIFKRYTNFKYQTVSYSLIFRLLHNTLPVAITMIIVMLYTRLDIVVLSSYLDTAAVGYYGLAYRVTEPFQMVAAAFAMSVYSHVSATLKTSKQQTYLLIRRYIIGVIVFGFLSCAMLLSTAPPIISQLLSEYTPALPIIQILAVAVIFRTLNGCLSSIIQAYGFFSRITITAVFNFFSIGGLLLVFVPTKGASGAALALLLGEVINTIIQTVILINIFYSNRNTLASRARELV